MSMRYPAGFISAFYNPLKNPDAPTIGTATSGISSVSVAFTAPSNVGGSAITGYTVQAIKTSDGSVTFTTGTSSPISVTGLSATAYTFKVLATNSYGSSVLSAASNSATPVAIGDAYAGGYFGGQISTAGNGIADYNLVIAPKSSGENGALVQKTSNTTTAGTSSVIDGPTNSAAMNNASHPAAQFCEGLSIGGYSDWYLPATNELEIFYYNLKPTTTNNNTSSGINANAVPARASNYTTGTPAQTSASAFQSGGAQQFTSTFPSPYWTSTQTSATQAALQNFDTGAQGGQYKNNQYNVRGVRRVAV